jgi:hypothetical protein
MTTGINTSCIHKRDLNMNYRNSYDTNLTEHYKLYCKMLSKIIKVVNKLQYDNIILNYKNKMKTTRNITKSRTGKKASKEGVHLLNINGNLTACKQF